MSEQKKDQSGVGASAVVVVGATLLGILIAANSSPPPPDVSFAEELRPGGRVAVEDFGSFEFRTEHDGRIVYTLPEWLLDLPFEHRWTLVRLEHRSDPGAPWAVWPGAVIRRRLSEYGSPGYAAWVRPDAHTEEAFRCRPGEEGAVAVASLPGLCPGHAYQTFYVRVAVRDGTQQWNYSPTVPVTAHPIRRGAGRK